MTLKGQIFTHILKVLKGEEPLWRTRQSFFRGSTNVPRGNNVQRNNRNISEGAKIVLSWGQKF